MPRGPVLVKYKVVTVPIGSNEELTAVLNEHGQAELVADRYELHSMYFLDGVGIVLVLWRNFKT